MYSKAIVIQQTIKLFTDKVEYRDDRYGTVNYIVSTYYMETYGRNIKVDFKLMTDIDRAFRYIQQFEPSLRGGGGEMGGKAA
jgi:hypothetical protein